MTTILVARGETCNAACYDATGATCRCICGGVLHGVGRARAAEIAPILVAGGRATVAMLELPLTSAPDDQSTAGASAAVAPAAGPVCVKCGRPESVSPGQLPYEVGPVCSACRRRRLELREEVG